MKRITPFLSLVLAACSLLPALGQEKIQQDVIVVKSYLPSVQDARKITFLPDINDSILSKPSFSYSILSKRFPTHFIPQPIRPAKMLPEPLPRLYGNYVKLGLGSNFSSNMSSLAELSLSTLRNREYMAGILFKHQAQSGSIQVKNEKYYPNWADNEIRLFGKKFLSRSVLSSSIYLSQQKRQFYGNPAFDIDNTTFILPKDSIEKQRFSVLETELSLHSIASTTKKNNYLAKLNYSWFADRFSFNEHRVSTEGWYSAPFKEKFTLKAYFGLDYLNHSKDTIHQSNTVIQITPSITRVFEESVFEAGVRINPFFQSDEGGTFHLHPFANFQYRVYDKYLVSYFGLDGQTQNNTIRNLTSQNPFFSTEFLSYSFDRIQATTQALSIFAGFKGNISSLITFDTRIGYAEWQNDYFFRPGDYIYFDPKFRIVPGKYDLLSVNAELALKKPEGFSFLLQASYKHYSNISLTDWSLLYSPNNIAWLKPNLEIDLDMSYNLGNKLIAKTNLFFIGKRTAPLPLMLYPTMDFLPQDESTELKPVLDVNLGLEYRYNRKASAFIELNNLLGQKYCLFNGYPVYGFTLMLGVSYGF
jgi:hypothetical protein